MELNQDQPRDHQDQQPRLADLRQEVVLTRDLLLLQEAVADRRQDLLEEAVDVEDNRYSLQHKFYI